MIFSLVAMTGLEKCCITSAYLQWLCHSGERPVACGPLVFLLLFFFDIKKIIDIFLISQQKHVGVVFLFFFFHPYIIDISYHIIDIHVSYHIIDISCKRDNEVNIFLISP